MAEFRKMLTEDGVIILSYQIELPDFEENEERGSDVAAFYREIAERALLYLEEVVAEHLRAEYRAREDARKRFSFRPMVYRMTVRREGECGIVRRVTLSRAGRLLFEQETADFLSGGKVLPYQMKNTQKSRKLRRSACNKDKIVL